MGAHKAKHPLCSIKSFFQKDTFIILSQRDGIFGGNYQVVFNIYKIQLGCKYRKAHFNRVVELIPG